MVLVLLGTQNNSFHRLLEEVQKCIDNKIINTEVIVQAGCTKFESDNMKIFGLIPTKELNNYIQDADYIICHGGVGSIVTSLKLNKKIIAVPRQKKYNEHVNDHQVQIIETFDGQGFIKGIKDVSDLEDAIKTINTFEPQHFVSNTNKILNIVSDFIDNN
ncbi:MAG: hypothetical protein IJH76_05170 [Clostridia bacterium]|nr:hypothetical protein [Clostridia bacterium]